MAGEPLLRWSWALANGCRIQFAVDSAGVLDEQMDVYFTKTIAECQQLLIDFLIIVKGAGKNIIYAGEFLNIVR